MASYPDFQALHRKMLELVILWFPVVKVVDIFGNYAMKIIEVRV